MYSMSVDNLRTTIHVLCTPRPVPSIIDTPPAPPASTSAFPQLNVPIDVLGTFLYHDSMYQTRPDQTIRKLASPHSHIPGIFVFSRPSGNFPQMLLETILRRFFFSWISIYSPFFGSNLLHAFHAFIVTWARAAERPGRSAKLQSFLLLVYDHDHHHHHHRMMSLLSPNLYPFV
jgi:hypothetical protein